MHLHNHTQYSLLDGLTKIPSLLEYVKDLGMEAVAMTDHGTMSGAIEFYKAGQSSGIKSIIGMEAYVAARGYKDRDSNKDRQYFHLTMLSMNNTGYQNLMRLSSIANLKGFYYKPRVDRSLIEKYNDGLIILSGCIGSELSDALRQGQYQKGVSIAEWYKKIFGDRYYIELQDHGHPAHPTAWDEQTNVNQQLLKIANQLSIPALVSCDAHYLKKEDQEAHEILLCVQTGAYLSDEKRFSLKEFELYVANPKDVIKRWGKDNPELITNTKKIADRCEIKIELGKILIPQFSTPPGETEKSLLQKNIWRGLAWRYGRVSREEAQKLTLAAAKKGLSEEVIDRAEYELSVVDSMGFNGYFLIVSDFINWGKDREIVFGPGRGSAASSILAYATRITEIDPLKYDLLFERFLNPDRISMPDMDIDIQDTRRDEVINYCIEKYGRDRVANIATFGRMAARNSVRDVARVLQVPYSEADRLAKMIPPPVQGRHTLLEKHLKEVNDLKLENKQNPSSARVFELATRLEGTIRSHGVHAAGVVIAPDEIVKYVPLERAQNGAMATQYSMGPIEDLGLLKMDFLGLSNLTTIKNTLRIVKKVYGEVIDINSVPLDDQKTFELLQKGSTTGVFQLESAGMKRYLKDLKPTMFEDIIAMVALYRPGPMQWIEDFIARKHGQRKIEYMHPAMEPSLKNTYGVIVYQEQVMQISKEMCNFTGGQADTLRKAIGKKNLEVMAKLKNDFIEGAIKTVGADKKMMENFWQQLEEFAAYCFNKVHSACYAMIAYQTAYLKANYPAAFMAALMTSDRDNTDRLAIEISECSKMGIKVLPPDVNESFHEFAVVPGTEQIRFGLDAVKNVGYGAVEEIIRARNINGGSFESIDEFCKTVDCHIVNRKALESLIKAGALDRFSKRGRLLNNLDSILSFSHKVQKDKLSGQVDLFGGSTLSAGLIPQLQWNDNGPEYSQNEMLGWERELMGLYMSHHPLDAYKLFLSEKTFPILELSLEKEGSTAEIGGMIISVREISTKNGAKMAFVRLSDVGAEIEVVVFPKIYNENPEMWQRDSILVVKGKLSSGGRGGGNELKMLADKAKAVSVEDVTSYESLKKQIKSSGARTIVQSKKTVPLLKIKPTSVKRLYIRMQDSRDQPLLMALKQKLETHHGETEVVLVTGSSSGKQAIKLPQTISINESSLRDLASAFGPTNIVVR